jgi:hypothetical protein
MQLGVRLSFSWNTFDIEKIVQVGDKMVHSSFWGMALGNGIIAKHLALRLGMFVRSTRLGLASHMVVRPKQTYLHYYKQIITKNNLTF